MISINLLGILGAQCFGYVNRSIPVSCNLIGRVNQNTSYAYFHNLHTNMLLTTCWQTPKLLIFVIKKNEKLLKMTSITSYINIKIVTQLLDHQHMVLWLFGQQLRIIEIPKYQHDWSISITGTCMYCVYGYLRAYYVCVHLYGCVQMRARGCTSEFVHVHISVCVRICMWVRECTYIYVRTYHTYVCTCLYTRTCKYVFSHVRTKVYVGVWLTTITLVSLV